MAQCYGFDHWFGLVIGACCAESSGTFGGTDPTRIQRQPPHWERKMTYQVDFKEVSTVGLESSPVSAALAGLRANEARYFWNKYSHQFTTEPASQRQDILDYVNTILLQERDLAFAAQPLETSQFEVDGIKWTHVFYADGLGLNVLYTVDNPGKRAVGFKLSEGMAVPPELEGKFKFARQRSKLAGEIRGSFFVIKGEYS